MKSKTQPSRFGKILIFMVVLVFLLTTNCMIGELFVMQLNEDRTATSFAVDTAWRMTYTEEARLYNYGSLVVSKVAPISGG